jgi:hypothetical protein
MTTPRKLELRLVSSQPRSEEALWRAGSGFAQRLWPTHGVEAVILEASISQAFASSRILEPVRRQLALRGLFSFGYLVGLTRQEIFQGTPKVLKVRQAFVVELEELGFIFSSVPLPVRRWRRQGQLFKHAKTLS